MGCSFLGAAEVVTTSYVRTARLSELPLPRPMLIHIADGKPVLVTKFITTQMIVGDVLSDLQCLVMGEKADFDIIVGFSWLRRHNAILDFGRDVICVRGASGHVAELSMRRPLPPRPHELQTLCAAVSAFVARVWILMTRMKLIHSKVLDVISGGCVLVDARRRSECTTSIAAIPGVLIKNEIYSTVTIC